MGKNIIRIIFINNQYRKKSNLNFEKKILQCEKIRNNLIKNNELNPAQMFYRIDLNKKGYIDPTDMKKFLLYNKFFLKIK